MGEAAWSAVEAVAVQQSGLVSRDQVVAAGFPARAFENRVRAGEVLPLHRGLYEVAPPRQGDDRELQTALILGGPEAVLSHRSAAQFHRLWGVDGRPLEVTVPRRLRLPVPGLTVHRASLPPTDQIDRGGLRVTTVRRTLRDLACHLDFVAFAGALEAARKKDRDLLPAMKEWLKARHLFAPEVAQMIALLIADCESRERPFDSYFEVEFWHRWLFNGLDRPIPQLKVRDRAGNLYIDFAFPHEKVAVETQGYQVRETRESVDYDAGRTNRLSAMGWVVIPVTKTLFREQFASQVRLIEGTRKTRR